HVFWLVQDAIMTLLSRNEVCPRSNLSLALAGATLDPLAQLQNLKGLKAGAILRLVEGIHVFCCFLQRLFFFFDITNYLHKSTIKHLQGFLSFNLIHIFTAHCLSSIMYIDGAPPEYLLPGSSERPLMALLPHSSQPEVYLRDLSLSCWNPPPGHRKLQGDFLYITVVTMEGRRCDITSCPKGFFLNRSTEDVFDPRPAQSSPVCHCLTDLLCHISPGFKQTFTTLKNRQLHRLFTAEDGCFQIIAGSSLLLAVILIMHTIVYTQAPDWNEELQAARDLPQGSLEERLQRDKAVLQVNSAFVSAVMQGAETVVDGFVEPVNRNPEDPAFLWGGLFMSQGAASAVFGGERGRRAAQRLELKGVQAYSDLEGLQGLHTLPTAIVDYRGVRLSAQGLAPGLEGSEGLLYGVNAGPQESPHRRQLLELLAHSAKSLSLQRHVVLAPNGHQVPLFTSVDAQGLLGADGRFYLLDVFRSFPADANFCPEVETESFTVTGEEESNKGCEEGENKKGCIKEGWPEDYHTNTDLPRSYPHGLCRLRPELVQAFIQHNLAVLFIYLFFLVSPPPIFTGDSRATAAVRAACKDVGSVSDIIFEMRFNPNVFSSGVAFPLSENTSTKLQERLLREAAAFVITHQIPLESCLQSSEAPMDGATLKNALHQRGINLRYLGHVIKAITQSEYKEHLRHIMRTVIAEIFIRSTKRVFNSFLQGVDVPSLSVAVSHFLSCLLVPHFSPTSVGEETKKKSRRRGRGSGASESTPWSTLTGAELWNLVCQDAAETYNVSDSLGSGPNHLVDLYGLQKLSLLREFCLKTGVQVLRLRDYYFDNQNKVPVGPDDILNIIPVVKHVHMPTLDASKAYHAAQISIQKGSCFLYIEYKADISTAENSNHNCPVALKARGHEWRMDVWVNCSFKKLSISHNLCDSVFKARSVQLKAVVISERVLGFDHPNTIQQYALLGVYVYAGGETALAQRFLLRARLLMLTVHGEDHPYTATLDVGLKDLSPQSKFLKNALKLNTSFFGTTNLQTALNQHLLAQWMCRKGDYRSAMTHEKEALTAFTSLFGEDHPQTRCSKDFLSTITKQAVKVERTLRQAGAECTEATVEVGAEAHIELLFLKEKGMLNLPILYFLSV
uniref:Si:ch211-166a6.5 n=1 Tax=Amphilophus citrinellus TaxID=61819 RepID=A0A3Q0SUS9_AMPCI